MNYNPLCALGARNRFRRRESKSAKKSRRAYGKTSELIAFFPVAITRLRRPRLRRYRRRPTLPAAAESSNRRNVKKSVTSSRPRAVGTRTDVCNRPPAREAPDNRHTTPLFRIGWNSTVSAFKCLFAAENARTVFDIDCVRPSGNPDILICGNCREMFTELQGMLDHKKEYCKLRFTCKCNNSAKSNFNNNNSEWACQIVSTLYCGYRFSTIFTR